MGSSVAIGVPKMIDDDIYRAIRKLKNKSIAEQHQIPSFPVKDYYNVFAKPLNFLLYKQLFFLNIWKLSSVRLVFKSGNVKISTLINMRLQLSISEVKEMCFIVISLKPLIVLTTLYSCKRFLCLVCIIICLVFFFVHT